MPRLWNVPERRRLRRLGAALLTILLLYVDYYQFNLLGPNNNNNNNNDAIRVDDGTRSIAGGGDHNGNSLDGDDGYLKWLLGEQNRSVALQLQVHHRGQSGLGHQLQRLSCVYHLAMLYKIPRVWLDSNPVCGGRSHVYSIHNFLLGPHDVDTLAASPLLVDVPYSYTGRAKNMYEDPALVRLPAFFPNLTFVNETAPFENAFKRYVSINNDVRGYHNMHDESQLEEMIQHDFWGKDASDYQMYDQMMVLFGRRHAERVRALAERVQWHRHTVFGLHIRTGNGEKGDFAAKRRGMPRLDAWVVRAVRLLCDYRHAHPGHFVDRPLLLYVGTDTASVVPQLRAASDLACRIPVVSAAQRHPGDGEGASFRAFANPKGEATETEACLDGWRDMFLDMYAFTRCNTVVAGTYSSFTQAAPLSYVMHKAKAYRRRSTATAASGDGDRHPHYFCEMGNEGNRMDCFDTLASWLRRTAPVVEWGNLAAPKQRMRHEVQFPSNVSARAIHPMYFEGTALRRVLG